MVMPRRHRRRPVKGTDLQTRSYWVVSPNLRNNPTSVDAWRRACVASRAAFMGWGADDPKHAQIGPKFAGRATPGIMPGDVIVIARRHRNRPEIVGFGVVHGQAQRPKGLRVPHSFGSLRRLRPFRAWSRPPARVPFAQAVRHIRALAQLHPDINPAHRRVCEWLAEHLQEGSLPSKGQRTSGRHGRITTIRSIRAITAKENYQLDWEVRTPARVSRAKAREARLLADYQQWLIPQKRKVVPLLMYGLRCDAFEHERNNLIEAKSSVRREYIRMAVGQLLDYAFLARRNAKDPGKAILVPRRPGDDVLSWLQSLGISVIWRKANSFVDNANGRFT